MAQDRKAATEAETRLAAGAAAGSRASTGLHEGMQERFYSGGLENPNRETGARNAEESRELEVDQRLGLGKGLLQVAGASKKSTSQRHHYTKPSCFCRATDQHLPALGDLLDPWFVPRRVS